MIEIKMNTEHKLTTELEGTKIDLFKEFGYIYGSVVTELVEDEKDLELLEKICESSLEFHLGERLKKALNDLLETP